MTLDTVNAMLQIAFFLLIVPSNIAKHLYQDFDHSPLWGDSIKESDSLAH